MQGYLSYDDRNLGINNRSGRSDTSSAPHGISAVGSIKRLSDTCRASSTCHGRFTSGAPWRRASLLRGQRACSPPSDAGGRRLLMDEGTTLTNATKLLKCNNDRPGDADPRCRACGPTLRVPYNCMRPRSETGRRARAVHMGSVGASQVIEAAGATRLPEHAAASRTERGGVFAASDAQRGLTPGILRCSIGRVGAGATIPYTSPASPGRATNRDRYATGLRGVSRRARYLETCPSSC